MSDCTVYFGWIYVFSYYLNTEMMSKIINVIFGTLTILNAFRLYGYVFFFYM